jgi:hypothetical protein
MSKYFSGQSQGSFLPPGFMQAATQSGQLYASALASVGKSIGEGIRRRGEKKKDDAYFNFIEATGKIDDATKSVSQLVSQGKPLDTPESKAFGQKTAGDRNQALNEADYWDDLLKQKDDAYLLQQYVGDQSSNADPTLRKLFGEGEKKAQQAAQSVRSDLINSALDPTMLGEVGSQPRLMGMDGQFGESTPAPANIPQPPPAPLDPNGPIPLPTMEEAAALNPELYPGLAASGSFNEGEMGNWTDNISYEDQNKVMTAGLKKAKAWARGKAKDLRALAAQKENTLAAWEQGRELIADDAGDYSLGDLIKVPGQVERKLTDNEKRDMAESKLSTMARSMGRERFKEARVQLDKQFPDKPEIETVDLGGYTVITEDGSYKAAIKTPNRSGNQSYAALTENQQKLADTTYTNIGKDEVVESYHEGVLAYRKIEALVKGKNAITDSALVTTFNKILDPRSIVTEGEQRIYKSAEGAIEFLDRYARAITEGPTVSEPMRAQFAEASKQIIVAHKKLAQERINNHKDFAESRGIPFDLVAPKLPDVELTGDTTATTSNPNRFVADLSAGTLNPAQ